jgi:hypothetical protein
MGVLEYWGIESVQEEVTRTPMCLHFFHYSITPFLQDIC